MKVCSKCKEEKIINLFSKNKNYRDGLESQCKECTKKRLHKWRENNHEYDLQRKIEWRDKNIEYDKKRKAKWSSENLNKRRMSFHKRNIKIKENIFYISEKEIKKILNSACFYCSSYDNIQVDHVVPVSKGGRHSVGNIVAACRSCNASKCDKYLIEWKKRKK